MDIPIFLATAAVEPSLSWPEITFRLFAILFLVLLNGFFVAAEFALIAVRRTRIEQLVEEGNRAAEAVQRAQKDIDKALSASQIGITLASLALGWVGEPTISAVLRPFFQTVGLGEFLGKFPFASGEKSVEVLSIALAFFLISYMHIVLGELAPKSIAIQYAEKTALTVAQPNQVFYYLFAPFMKILNFSSNLVLRVLKVEPVLNMHHSGLSSEELQLMIAASSESGALEAGERELLSNIFEFGDVVASEVMVPRTRINSIEIDSTFQDLLAEVAPQDILAIRSMKNRSMKCVDLFTSKTSWPKWRHPTWTSVRLSQTLRLSVRCGLFQNLSVSKSCCQRCRKTVKRW
jgi:CBS domain containing-hemolysin-like protein